MNILLLAVRVLFHLYKSHCRNHPIAKYPEFCPALQHRQIQNSYVWKELVVIDDHDHR